MYEDALASAEESLQILQNLFGADDWRTGLAYRLVADVLRRGGDRPRALEMAETSLKIMLSAFGHWHRQTSAVYGTLGLCRSACSDHIGALSAFEDSHEISLRVLGPAHGETATSKFNLGVEYYRQGSFDTGTLLIDEGLRSGFGAFGATHPIMVDRRVTKLMLIARTHPAKRGAAYQSLVKIRKELPAEHPSIPDLESAMDQIRPPGFRKEASSSSLGRSGSIKSKRR
jgi:hypothetical protein